MPWTWVRPADPTLLAGRPLLDVGTGDGQTIAAVADRPGLIVGIDASLDALHAARRGAAGHVVAAAASGIPFRDEAFATVLAADLFHHLDDAELDLVLDELHRVVGRDGRIVAWWYELPGRGGVGDPRFPRAYADLTARIRSKDLTASPIDLEIVEGTPKTVGAVLYRSGSS